MLTDDGRYHVELLHRRADPRPNPPARSRPRPLTAAVDPHSIASGPSHSYEPRTDAVLLRHNPTSLLSHESYNGVMMRTPLTSNRAPSVEPCPTSLILPIPSSAQHQQRWGEVEVGSSLG